jgi:FKBP-type peptidyl-prolyl cis-trans isomerase FklB
MKIGYKIFVLLFLMVGVSINNFGQKSKKDSKNDAAPVITPLTLNTQIDSVSYALGIYLGNNLKQQGLDKINADIFAAGIKDYSSSPKPIIDNTQASEIISRYIAGQRKVKANKNIEEGKLFLEKNKSVPGVVELPSGLQYQVIITGTGNKPTLEDKVTVNYHGTLLNGKVFDSSVERGKPIQLNVNQVIDGWKEALQLMTVGSKWKLFIPSNLAYGENPQPGGPIEPNSVLIFEVELISIDKDQPDTQKPSDIK